MPKNASLPPFRYLPLDPVKAIRILMRNERNSDFLHVMMFHGKGLVSRKQWLDRVLAKARGAKLKPLSLTRI